MSGHTHTHIYIYRYIYIVIIQRAQLERTQVGIHNDSTTYVSPSQNLHFGSKVPHLPRSLRLTRFTKCLTAKNMQICSSRFTVCCTCHKVSTSRWEKYCAQSLHLAVHKCTKAAHDYSHRAALPFVMQHKHFQKQTRDTNFPNFRQQAKSSRFTAPATQLDV